ncbi:glycosyltransferase family 25 protein [Nonomuraea sp. NPDC003804]|uniref:glycosyltransferase family 25 protein n=1 Tax=Nonomuraea sp. NPDC003804 TaxID=3154547 RepID=UPI0033BFB2A5
MFELSETLTYVVNLRRRPDRRARMRRILPPEMTVIFTSDWAGPFDGHSLSPELLDRHSVSPFPWQVESANPWWNRPLKLGEIGCSLSHLACWRHALTTDKTYAMVLEDDAVLADGFVDRLTAATATLSSADGIGLVYLGRVPLEQDRPYLPGMVSPGYSHCTYGYILSRPAITALLAAELEKAIIPIDEFLPAMYMDHPRMDVRARFPRRISALACDPSLVEQLPKEEAGSDTEDSGFLPSPAALNWKNGGS